MVDGPPSEGMIALREGRAVSKPLEILYRWRGMLATLYATGVLLAVWLLLADAMIFSSSGRALIAHLRNLLGFWPVADQTIRGVFGLWPAGFLAYLSLLALLFGVWFISQPMFLGMRKPDPIRLLRRESDPTIMSALAAAVMFGALAVGAFAFLAECLGGWSTWYHTSSRWRWIGPPREGLAIGSPFFHALSVFALAYTVSLCVLVRLWRQGDAYQRRQHTLFALFVWSGLMCLVATLTLIATMLRADPAGVAFTGPWARSGFYAAALVGGAVALWCGAPGLVLLYASRPRHRLTNGLCLACGYDLNHIAAAACPECGESTTRPAVPA